MTRLRPLLFWLLPPALFLWVDWYAVRAWFHQDDFAWLSLGHHVQSWPDFWSALFHPYAQGTVRPWSERLFFLGLSHFFWLDHRPYHLVTAFTQIANLTLLQAITWRLTGSRLAAVAAPCIWMASLGLAIPVAWLSAYNQILCASFLLAAFYCLLRYLESGRMAWFHAQTAIFLLGFGALEINIVYPALATVWCWLGGRPALRRVLWLWIPALAYGLLHFTLIPKPAAGPYARHWDLSIVQTYAAYWAKALTASRMPADSPLPADSWRTAAAILAAATAAFLFWAWRQRLSPALFGFAWFTLALAPVLPLRDHQSDYYLAIPAAGLAWIAASALQAAFGARSPAAIAAACLLVGTHLAFTAPVHREAALWHFQRGLDARYLVGGLERAMELHPGKMIVLTGLDSVTFYTVFYDARQLFPQTTICLAPGSQEAFSKHPEFGDLSPYICAPASIAAAAARQLVVYSRKDLRLHNVTRFYRRRLPRQGTTALPSVVDVADPALARFLGPGWFGIQDRTRWMGPRAELTLAAPDRPGRTLFIRGYRPPAFLHPPVHLSITAGGALLGRFLIHPANASFDFSIPLPPEFRLGPSLHLVLEIDRPARAPGDVRPLGAVFGTVGWR